MSSQPGKAPQWGPDRRRRRYPRYHCDFPVTLSLFSGKEHRHIEGRGRDLAQAGIGILIADEIPIGEVVSLAFSLPDAAQAWIMRAVVRQRRGYHYGFEFLSFSAEHAEELKRYLPSLKRADSD
jgi:c-di-GMP-binding flagellar brake protein YcgR